LEEPDRLPGEIDDDTLRKYFTLSKADLEQVDQCRGPTNRLGFAVQLCTLRWHGYFLPDTRDILSSVVEMIGSQLGLLPIAPDNYPQNEKTRFEHLERIRQHLGFVRCDAPQRERLLNHLIAIAQGLARATALRQAARSLTLAKPPCKTFTRCCRKIYLPDNWRKSIASIEERIVSPSLVFPGHLQTLRAWLHYHHHQHRLQGLAPYLRR